MIIYTNEGNPLSLKLQIFAKLVKKDVSVRKIDLNDSTIKTVTQLPILELDSGTQLFSTDAVAKLFFPEEGILRDEWLEWASNYLTPVLIQYLSERQSTNSDFSLKLNILMQTLDDQLKLSPFVAGSTLSAADISIWCLLAPNEILRCVKNFENVILWYKEIGELPEVETVLAEQPLKNFNLLHLQQSTRYAKIHFMGLAHSANNKSDEQENSENVTVSGDEAKIANTEFVFETSTLRKEDKTVLPKKGERNVLITSALPYVNNVPHLGNIIGCVLSADIFARYCRVVGYNTLYVSGTDEYGTATENKAIAENLSPRQICDKYFEIHNSIYRWFGIGFDYFGRTTHAEQTEIVQQAFKDIYDAGYMFTESVEQLLCEKCERFLADRFVEGTCPHVGCGYEDARGDQCDKCGKLVNAIELIRPRCKKCSNSPVIRSSKQLFLDLPKTEIELKHWIEKVENGWTNNARVITRAWLKEGLKPRCITRDLEWGIPVPLKGFEKKVFYVWFDAPFGYISMTKRYTKDYKEWWQPKPDINVELYHFMAKDNVPFHSVMFPSCILAINKNYTLVSHIMATEYLNYEEGKFSKSRGVGVFGNDAQNTGIPADVWRFYLASARPENQDSSFNWNDFGARNNSELLNNFGNFVNRALVFCEKNFESIIPYMNLMMDDSILLALINRELKGYFKSLENAKLRDGIRHILSISRHGNVFMQTQQPWVLLKGTDDQKSRAGTIIGICCNIACLLANLLFPYMPSTARKLFNQLNIKQIRLNPKKPFVRILLKSGHKIGQPSPLFTKIDPDYIEELKKKFSGPQVNAEQNTHSKIDERQNKQTDVSLLEEAIRAQGDKVRTLKSNKVEKAVWQPEVAILLDLKKCLNEALTNAPKDGDGKAKRKP